MAPSRTPDGGWRLENEWCGLLLLLPLSPCWARPAAAAALLLAPCRGQPAAAAGPPGTPGAGIRSQAAVGWSCLDPELCFKPSLRTLEVRVIYEACLQPGGPYSRGIPPGAEPHLPDHSTAAQHPAAEDDGS